MFKIHQHIMFNRICSFFFLFPFCFVKLLVHVNFEVIFVIFEEQRERERERVKSNIIAHCYYAIYRLPEKNARIKNLEREMVPAGLEPATFGS